MKNTIKMLRGEIEWCKKHSKDKKSPSKEEQRGFVKGLRHTIRLIQLLNGE